MKERACCVSSTACGHRMAHRKWKETKQLPGMLPGPVVPGCSLVAFHFLLAILCPQAERNYVVCPFSNLLFVVIDVDGSVPATRASQQCFGAIFNPCAIFEKKNHVSKCFICDGRKIPCRAWVGPHAQDKRLRIYSNLESDETVPP